MSDKLEPFRGLRTTSEKYVVHWKTRNGEIGHGDPMSFDDAKVWAAFGNREFLWIEHWAERVKCEVSDGPQILNA